MIKNIFNKFEIFKTTFKILILSSLCIVITLMIASAISVVILKTDFNYDALIIISGGILAVSAFSNSYMISKWQKEKGLICGVLVASILSVFIIVINVINGYTFTPIFLTKLSVIFISASAGGIIGVNTN